MVGLKKCRICMPVSGPFSSAELCGERSGHARPGGKYVIHLDGSTAEKSLNSMQ